MPAGRLEVVVFVGRKVSWRGLHPRVDDTLSGSPTGSTYREHATGSFLIINNEDILRPAASFYLHGTGTGSDGSQIRLTSRGHFVLGKRTGQVRRNTNIITCRVSSNATRVGDDRSISKVTPSGCHLRAWHGTDDSSTRMGSDTAVQPTI